MQTQVAILSLILIQVVVLLVVWLRSTQIILFQPMLADSLNEELLNETQAANPRTASPTDAVVLPPCPGDSPHLVGPIRVEFNWSWTIESVRAGNPTLLEGGRYKPPDCISHHKVAIIIPFRNRHQHLIQWLNYLHPILQRQQLDYGVYVINQDGEGTFNRAKLFNVGFIQALKEYKYDCFVFSDVDLVPLDDRNIYGCFGKPRHLSVAVDTFNFRLPYGTIFGGVVSFSTQQFITINGFSNNYWGWGGEDDDLYQRLTMKSMTISRPDMQSGRYKMIKHVRDRHNEANPQRFNNLIKTQSTMQQDGINSLEYKINKIEKDKLYTFITVDIGSPQ